MRQIVDQGLALCLLWQMNIVSPRQRFLQYVLFQKMGWNVGRWDIWKKCVAEYFVFENVNHWDSSLLVILFTPLMERKRNLIWISPSLFKISSSFSSSSTFEYPLPFLKIPPLLLQFLPPPLLPCQNLLEKSHLNWRGYFLAKHEKGFDDSGSSRSSCGMK